MIDMKKKTRTYQEIQRELSESADQRAAEVRRLKDEEGLTFEEIGKRFTPPISKQRAEQLYKRATGGRQ